MYKIVDSGLLSLRIILDLNLIEIIKGIFI